MMKIIFDETDNSYGVQVIETGEIVCWAGSYRLARSVMREIEADLRAGDGWRSVEPLPE